MKNMRKTVLAILPLTFLLFSLSGCKAKEEREARHQERINLAILDSYDYDKVKVVVEEEKSPKDLAQDIMLKNVGIDLNAKRTYAEYGVAENQGPFIEMAVKDGPTIPLKPAMSEDEIKKFNSYAVWEERQIKEYDSLLVNRKEALQKYKDSDTEEADITERIAKEVEEQKARIKEQEKAKKKEVIPDKTEG